jgi:uncharacterized protein (TIGR00375 family)
MKDTILDLHVHSKYSRACSKELLLPNIAKACERRGIDIVATGDFTHPGWFRHMEEELEEAENGVYRLKNKSSATRFIIGTELASIKKHAGQTRRVHHLVFAPNLVAAKKFIAALEARQCNLRADGRPIVGLTSKDLLSLMLEADARMVMVPAHAWTPWFGVFGSKGGYDTLEECFEDLTPHIFAIETGLSSDPAMNWQCSMLDRITLISNSDAHSLQKLGREANVLRFEEGEAVTYDAVMNILRGRDCEKFLYTIEFFPEEGKYHLDGHADCRFSCTPEECARYGGRCPTCKKPLTIGVMHRVAELADRSEDAARLAGRIPYRSIVPLPEILGSTLEVGSSAKSVQALYDRMIAEIGNEFFILLHADLAAIAKTAGPAVAEAIRRVREGNVTVVPGYDGIFGVVKVFAEGEKRGLPKQERLLFE